MADKSPCFDITPQRDPIAS